MTKESIWETVRQALAEEFELEPASLSPEARLKEDLGLDSLDMVDMVIVLETRLGFKIQDKAALARISSLAEAVDLVAAAYKDMRPAAEGGANTRPENNDGVPER